MRVGQASVSDLIGIVVYLVTWYFFFRLLVGLLPPSAGRRTLLVVGAGLFALGGAFGVVGSALLGWPPLWILFYQQLYRPASAAEVVAVPLWLLAGLAVWGALSRPGWPAHRADRCLTMERIALVVAIGVLYEVGMVVFAWPPPWPWLLPNGPA
jgi:hypothetical protein